MPATLAPSMSSVHTDPLRNFRFQVRVNHQLGGGLNVIDLGFAVVSGLAHATAAFPYREGGYNIAEHQTPTQRSFSPITLTRGATTGRPQLAMWNEEVGHIIQGDIASTTPADNDFKADVDIYLLAHPWTRSTKVPVKMAWKVYGAWPGSLSYSDLDATTSAVLIEQMVLQHDGWQVTYAAPGAASDLGIFPTPPPPQDRYQVL